MCNKHQSISESIRVNITNRSPSGHISFKMGDWFFKYRYEYNIASMFFNIIGINQIEQILSLNIHSHTYNNEQK